MGLLDYLEHQGARYQAMPGWSTAGRPGTFAPRAIMWHWTASFASAARPCPTLDIVRFGRAGLPGPLYSLLVGYDGIVRVIHQRIGNHAGAGSMAALALAASRGQAVPKRYRPGPDDATLNRLTWGISADYHPDQGPPPKQQVDGMIRASAAVCELMGWTFAQGFEHLNATRRKRDNDVWPYLTPLLHDHMDRLTTDLVTDQEDDMPAIFTAPDGKQKWLVAGGNRSHLSAADYADAKQAGIPERGRFRDWGVLNRLEDFGPPRPSGKRY